MVLMTGQVLHDASKLPFALGKRSDAADGISTAGVMLTIRPVDNVVSKWPLALGKRCHAADGISGVARVNKHVAMLMRGPVLLNFSNWLCRGAYDRAGIARCEYIAFYTRKTF